MGFLKKCMKYNFWWPFAGIGEEAHKESLWVSADTDKISKISIGLHSSSLSQLLQPQVIWVGG